MREHLFIRWKANMLDSAARGFAMAAVRSGELERFVSEALELEAKERLRNYHPADPRSGWNSFSRDKRR